MLKRLIPIFTNKYLITGVAFIVWITVFDRNNIMNQLDLYRTLKDLHHQKEYYLSEIKKDRQAATELKTNLKNLEKFAREKYLMKKDGEDVYLIIKK
jgi:cell division protein DivIC